jgi:short-subunit dehydrogenase
LGNCFNKTPFSYVVLFFMDVKNKVAIVTGASTGIGLATARMLFKKGAKLVLVARSKDKLGSLAKELTGSFVIVADISKVDQVEKTIKQSYGHFGRVDILVNNAGCGYDAPVEKTDPKILQYLFDLDFMGPVIAMKEVIPIMRKQGGGSIINISSGTALMFLPNMSAYSALKAALDQISFVAREELKKDNIIVNVVYPYITLTDFEKNTFKDASAQQWEESSEAQEAWAKADTAEYIAQRIVEGIESGKAEIFAHDWMKRSKAK